MSTPQPSPVFDNLDLDLVIKVFSYTIFSPFFAFFVPIVYVAQGASWSSPVVIGSCVYLLIVSLFWLIKFASQLWRNGGNWIFRGARIDWGEQIVVITGGSSGVGALLANTFAVRNVTVIVLDVEPLVSENYNITYYKCDVSRWEEVEAVSQKIIEEHGHPTILINNAGVVQGKLITELSPLDIKQTMDTNVLAHFWTIKAFLPNMIQEKVGHVISMASVMGLVGTAQLTDYCASKAAVIALHDSLRYELDKRHDAPNVRTTLLLPGHLQTPLFSKAPSLPMLSSGFYRFFTPTLQPHDLVKAVIAAIDDQESRTIMLPFYVNFVRLTTLLPSFGRDFFQWLSGADYAMEGFVKVTGRRGKDE